MGYHSDRATVEHPSQGSHGMIRDDERNVEIIKYSNQLAPPEGALRIKAQNAAQAFDKEKNRETGAGKNMRDHQEMSAGSWKREMRTGAGRV